MRSGLSATSYVVLGLVSVRPRAGHELAGYAERSIGNFFSLTRSQVYSELDRLCALGLLEATEVPQERLPTKRVYEIAAEGEAVLGGGWRMRRWIRIVSATCSWFGCSSAIGCRRRG